MIPIKIRKQLKKIFPGHFPHFLLVGAQKAATTSLYFYLNQHPSIIGSRPKEVRFFDRDENFDKGPDWYKHNFPNTKRPFGKYVYFEATPEYLYRSYVAQRIHEFDPQIKILMVLRNPVDRAFSAWLTYRQFGRRKHLPDVMHSGHVRGTENNIYKEFYSRPAFPSFEEVVREDIDKFNRGDAQEEPAVVRRGIYHVQVKRYLDLFGAGQVHIIGFKDLIGVNQVQTLNSILNFLALPPSDWHFLKSEQRNKSLSKESMPHGTYNLLQDFYHAHNESLFKLIGFKPNW